jgi:2OG-Fe(II) oxygenase superfamily
VTVNDPHEPFGDVERILGYQDAVDDSAPLQAVATELVVVSCFTPRFCKALIRAAEACGGFDSHPSDPVPGRELSIGQISPRLFDMMQNDLGSRIWPKLQAHWGLIDYHGLNDAFIIKYERGAQEELRLHHDVAQVSGSIKLNDEYTGAELEFPRQGYSNASLPIGSLLAWPSLVTHPHRSAPITSGTKYSLTLWFELPLHIG